MGEIMPRVGREAAHILIDALTAYDPDANDTKNTQAIELALERLTLARCITVEMDESSGMARVQVENLVMPALTMLERLIREVVLLAKVDRTEVIAMLRDTADGSL